LDAIIVEHSGSSIERETGRIVWVALREIGVEGGVFVEMEPEIEGNVEVKWREWREWRWSGDGEGTVCEKGGYLYVSCL
jgi:hypothetical protein